MTSFVFTGLGLSIGAKLVQANDRQAFIFFNNIQAFPMKMGDCQRHLFSATETREKIVPHFAQTGWRYSRACL